MAQDTAEADVARAARLRAHARRAATAAAISGCSRTAVGRGRFVVGGRRGWCFVGYDWTAVGGHDRTAIDRRDQAAIGHVRISIGDRGQTVVGRSQCVVGGRSDR